MSTVYKVTNLNSREQFSAKVINKPIPPSQLKSVAQALKFLRVVDSEYIVRFEAAYESKYELVILTELIEGYSLL